MENIFLIGPMGSGKTTIGRNLARRLGLEFFDSDHEIEARTGASINLIFDIEGESGFRDRESKMLDELTQRPGVLIATGGGAILLDANRRMLSQRGTVVYLSASIEQQLSRLRMDKSRPLLPQDNRREKLEALAAKRNPLYESIAAVQVPASNRSVKKTVDRILAALAERQAAKPAQPND